MDKTEYNFFDAPLRVRLADGKTTLVKADLFYCANGIVAIGGWTSEPLELAFEADGAELSLAANARHYRKDVNEALKRGDAAQLAFGLVASIGGCAEKLSLLCRCPGQNVLFRLPLPPQRAETALPPVSLAVLGKSAYETCRVLIKKKKFQSASASGEIEYAIRMRAPGYDNVIMLSGWLEKTDGSRLYATGKDQDVKIPFDLHFWHRPDIEAVKGPCLNKGQNGYGFIASVKNFPVSVGELEIWSERDGERKKLAEHIIDDESTFNDFINNFFRMEIPLSSIAECYAKAAVPAISQINKQHQALLAKRPVMRGVIGKPTDAPLYSIIIPLYGSLDFLAMQIMCFSGDSEAVEKAEIIYVLDDPSLLDAFQAKAAELEELFAVSILWISKGSNQGFSSANNLGASIAKGRYLVFMNSDVFPEHHGWLGKFAKAMENDSQIGIAGCLLLSPAGTIQHAGMDFKYDHYFKIWTNIHPEAGCDPALMNIRRRMVPAVTGACLAMERALFERIGGWSLDYIMGDFEDSDLCFMAMKCGKKVALLHDIVMTHLERQSFKLWGDGESRQRLAVLNALIHQTKWSGNLEQMASGSTHRKTSANAHSEENI